MPVRVDCPFCQAGYTLPDETLGKQIRCTQCGKAFAVGSPAPATPKVRPKPGKLLAGTGAGQAPARRSGGSPGTASPAPSPEAPRSGWGGACLVGCLILACLFVVLLAGASIAGWWLTAHAEVQPGPADSIMNPWTAPAREPSSAR
jgi:predicted Zn finger-like uncharacterized protein